MTVRDDGWVGLDHLVTIGFILNNCEEKRLIDYSKR